MTQSSATIQTRITRTILFALLFMMIGTMLELYLLDHYEGWQQLIPLLAIGGSLVSMGWYALQRTAVYGYIFLGFLTVTALSGGAGVYLHLAANLEFEQDMKPSAAFMDVFVESLSGALPTLAPASLIVLALIGYSYHLLITQTR